MGGFNSDLFMTFFFFLFVIFSIFLPFVGFHLPGDKIEGYFKALA